MLVEKGTGSAVSSRRPGAIGEVVFLEEKERESAWGMQELRVESRYECVLPSPFFSRTLPPPTPGIQRTSSRRSVTARGRTFDDGAGHLRGVGGPTIPQHHRRRRRGACGQCCFACLEKDFFDSNRSRLWMCVCVCMHYILVFVPPSLHSSLPLLSHKHTHTNVRSIFLHFI